jgi:hypothetical protein
MKYNNTAFIIIFILSIILFSCKKEQINTDGGAKLILSIDTLKFDTLFSTLGSTTKYFTLKNNTNKILQVKDLGLKRNTNNAYRINVDGDVVGSKIDIDIPAKDSVYVFVEVTINPSSANLPFVVEDEVEMTTNGNKQSILLQAYGQNAHFFDGEELETQTWNNDLPYVILNSILLKEGHELTINEGVKVYFGGNSGMFIKGTLKVNGSNNNQVEFRCLRNDKLETGTAYYDLPGQWLGLFFLRKSTNNYIDNLKIRGSLYGLNVGNTTIEEFPMLPAFPPDVLIKNSEIFNSSFYGIFGFNGIINAQNTVVKQCGKQAVSLVLGGDYQFNHCTFFVRSTNTIEHKDPLLYFSNFHTFSLTQPALKFSLERADFTNCIFYGSKDEEILPDDIESAGIGFNYKFDHCLIRTKTNTSLPNFSNCIINQNPKIKDEFEYDLHLDTGSVCINSGISTAVITDIEGKNRDASPDIGAYEF